MAPDFDARLLDVVGQSWCCDVMGVFVVFTKVDLEVGEQPLVVEELIDVNGVNSTDLSTYEIDI